MVRGAALPYNCFRQNLFNDLVGLLQREIKQGLYCIIGPDDLQGAIKL